MDIGVEAQGANFGDRRLTKRLETLAAVLARAPDASFPKATGTDAALEATYRFLNNEAVTAERIAQPHVSATVERCASRGVVLVVHDTTEFRFRGPRPGISRIASGDHGFLGHFALAVDPHDRAPLGVLGCQTHFRDGEPRHDRHPERHSDYEDRESYRWWSLVCSAEGLLVERATAVHVMDREADSFDLLQRLVADDFRFVVRGRVDREVLTEAGCQRMGDLCSGETIIEREVPVTKRVFRPRDPIGRRRRYPLRSARIARFAVSARKLNLRTPRHLGAGRPVLKVNWVIVREVNRRRDVEPIEWQLITSEPISSPAEVEAIVDAYRARWLIEEYFKALKTGCAYEKRQLETRRALLNSLAVFTPIAWQLLALRHLARHANDTPAANVLSDLKLRVLRKHPHTQLPRAATVRDAMRAIAVLGGHIANNGEAGWQVLGRGFEALLLLEQGAAIVLRCDQS